MPRLTISLPQTMYNRLSSLAIQADNSMSSMINRLIAVGLHHMGDDPKGTSPQCSPIEQHCQQLIIQMNVLIKNMSAEILKYGADDFEHLRQAALMKYDNLR